MVVKSFQIMEPLGQRHWHEYLEEEGDIQPSIPSPEWTHCLSGDVRAVRWHPADETRLATVADGQLSIWSVTGASAQACKLPTPWTTSSMLKVARVGLGGIVAV